MVEIAVSHSDSSVASQPVTWLSGEIATFANKIGPILWIGALAGAGCGVYVTNGRILIAPEFRFFVVAMLLATAFMIWLSLRVQRVGWSGRFLVVSNYLRQERIPFESVEAVEPVWWNYRRMVRIRLRSEGFGSVIYYIPRWAAFKCLWAAPEKELQELLAANREI